VSLAYTSILVHEPESLTFISDLVLTCLIALRWRGNILIVFRGYNTGSRHRGPTSRSKNFAQQNQNNAPPSAPHSAPSTPVNVPVAQDAEMAT
jgi:hypothetical protein